MYKILGADGKEYGPVTAEQLRGWIAEGRANQRTKVLEDGATEWKTLGDIPEFAASWPVMPATTSSLPAGTPPEDQVRGPAVGLMVTAVLGFLINLVGIFWNLLSTAGMGMTPPGRGPNPELERYMTMFGGTLGVVSGIVALGVAGLIFYGALKMKKLEGHGWAMAASILALAPCISPCCLIGLPVGIWALVVLARPEVKAAFN